MAFSSGEPFNGNSVVIDSRGSDNPTVKVTAINCNGQQGEVCMYFY